MVTLGRRIGRFLARFTAIIVVSGVLWSIPDIDTDSILRYKNAIVTFSFIVSLGKLLFDTLFFDRYQP